MTEYHISITDSALADMEDLYNYIALRLHSPENAMHQYNRIADAILSLDHLPTRNRIMESEPGHTRRLRKLLVDNYTVFYYVSDDTVIVTDVLYSASDIDQRLLNRGPTS